MACLFVFAAPAFAQDEPTAADVQAVLDNIWVLVAAVLVIFMQAGFALVEAGLLEKRRYSERPPRDEYVLTERGRDFKPVLIALVAFGKKHFAAPGGKVSTRFAGVFSPPPATSGRPAKAARR